MKYLLLLLFLLGFCAADGQRLSDLLDGDPDFPLVLPDENLFVFTSDQTNLMVTYLEDRINLRKAINALENDLKQRDLTILKFQDLQITDDSVIKTLAEVNKLKEEETLIRLEDLGYKVNRVDLFLGEERKALIAENKRLKRTVWGIIAGAAVAGTLIAISK